MDNSENLNIVNKKLKKVDLHFQSYVLSLYIDNNSCLLIIVRHK